jgi:hypothetical protein
MVIHFTWKLMNPLRWQLAKHNMFARIVLSSSFVWLSSICFTYTSTPCSMCELNDFCTCHSQVHLYYAKWYTKIQRAWSYVGAVIVRLRHYFWDDLCLCSISMLFRAALLDGSVNQYQSTSTVLSLCFLIALMLC